MAAVDVGSNLAKGIQLQQRATDTTSSSLPVIEIVHLFPNYRPNNTLSGKNDGSNGMIGGESGAPEDSRKRPAEETRRGNDNAAPDKKKSKKETSRPSWNERFEELKAFRKEHGHCLIPNDKGPYQKLRSWVHIQRRGYRMFMDAKTEGKDPTNCNGITEERIAELEKIGFVWRLRAKRQSPQPQISWEEHYAELVEYKKANGDCLVPAQHASNPHLGRWVANQRQMYRKLMEAKADGTCISSESEERIAKLNELGFSWVARPGHHSSRYSHQAPCWEERFEQLQEYKKVNGDCLVSQYYSEVPGLGVWVRTQRQMYEKLEKGNVMTKTLLATYKGRVEKLNQLGFSWTAPRSGPRTNKKKVAYR